MVADAIALSSANCSRKPRFDDIELERELILEEINEDYDEEGVEINADDIARGLRLRRPSRSASASSGHAANVAAIRRLADVRRHFDAVLRRAQREPVRGRDRSGHGGRRRAPRRGRSRECPQGARAEVPTAPPIAVPGSGAAASEHVKRRRLADLARRCVFRARARARSGLRRARSRCCASSTTACRRGCTIHARRPEGPRVLDPRRDRAARGRRAVRDHRANRERQGARRWCASCSALLDGLRKGEVTDRRAREGARRGTATRRSPRSTTPPRWPAGSAAPRSTTSHRR